MTKDIFELLDDDELDRLDQFLLDHVNEDDVTEGDDEGVLDVSELDGLFTAIVSGPVMIQPSQWLPAVWGDFEPEWDSANEAEQILSLMIRHMNGIAATLMEQPQDFEPMFLESQFKGSTGIIVDEWCEGYMRGVALAADEWEAGGMDISILLAPMSAFSSESGWRAHDFTSETEFENIRNAITPNAREIHAFWLARRGQARPSATTFQRAEPRVGRNDPCPCGSGKKYKKCCLH
jgi:uncharacterized protein